MVTLPEYADLLSYKHGVNGTTKTKILEITGGADIAEPFEIESAREIEPGYVISIDPENPGKFKIADKEYDRCVAGIVSGAGGIDPGMIMSQEGTIADGKYPIALTGRVYCRVDATVDPVYPGDLLATSNTPGHAMRVSDHSKANGAIIGKAITKLTKGKGLVLVLVALQ